MGPDQELWYELQLTLSLNRTNKRVLLHFGAVDWEAEVWVNGIRAGSHQGGFSPARQTPLGRDPLPNGVRLFTKRAQSVHPDLWRGMV